MTPSKLPWRNEFVEMGGYDCMTDAQRIYSGEQLVATVDYSDFGQDWCQPFSDDTKAKADANAALIVEAVNSHTALVERVAKLEAALQDALAYMEHNNIQQYADRQGSVEQIAYCSVRAALTEAALKWIPASERLPDVKPNNYQEFNVAIRREHNGETYVISACYLNALMLLTSDDDCPEEGKPYTGWCKLMNDDGDFDTAWNYIENCGDKVTHWQPLPEPPAALVKP